MNKEEQLLGQLADNLRSGKTKPEEVCKTLCIEENKDLAEKIVTYFINTKQHDLIKLLCETKLKLKRIEHLEKCWEL